MYLDELDSKEWVLNDALAKYHIKYRDPNIVKVKLKQHLLSTLKNPNVKKNCKDDCQKLLRKLDPHFAIEASAVNSKKRQTTAPSTVTYSGAVVKELNNIQGTVNMSANNDTCTAHNNKKRKTLDDIDPPQDEVDQLFNNVQNSPSEEYAPTFLQLQREIQVVPPQSHWTINDLNITNKFIKYQERCINIANASGFILETHAHEVLMLSSILLLKPNQHSDCMLQFFTQKELQIVRDQMMTDICGTQYEDIEFDTNTMIHVTKILKKLNKNSGNRHTAIMEINNLNIERTQYESSLLQSLINIIHKLPEAEIVDQLGEMELMCNYIDPVVFPLLTNYDQNTKLVWPNLVQKESKTNKNNVNQSRRPDAVIRVLHQHNYAEARGYGEVKTADRKEDIYELVRDLVRCSIFSKEAIDIHHMKGNIFFQAVGARITFYVFTLKADGIYVALEICSIKIPLSLKDLPFFITQFDSLLLVLTIYDKFCTKSEESPTDVSLKRPTLNSPTFMDYIDKKKSKFNRTTLIF